MNAKFGKMLLKEGHKCVEIRPHKGVVDLAGGGGGGSHHRNHGWGEGGGEEREGPTLKKAK